MRTQRWQGFKVWLAAHPVWAAVLFVALNLVGVLAGEAVAGLAGDFAGVLVRGLFLAGAIAVGIAYLSGRWEARR